MSLITRRPPRRWFSSGAAYYSTITAASSGATGGCSGRPLQPPTLEGLNVADGCLQLNYDETDSLGSAGDRKYVNKDSTKNPPTDTERSRDVSPWHATQVTSRTFQRFDPGQTECRLTSPGGNELAFRCSDSNDFELRALGILDALPLSLSLFK